MLVLSSMGGASTFFIQIIEQLFVLFSSWICLYAGTLQIWKCEGGGGSGGGCKTSSVSILPEISLLLTDAVRMIFMSEYVSYF